MLKSLNHYREFILNHLSRGPPNLFIPLGETEITHLGTEKIFVRTTAMISTGIPNSGGKMSMQLGGWTEVPQEEKGSTDVDLITKGKDILMLKMMPEAIWCRTE